MLQWCQRANEVNGNYTVRKSKWSGNVIVDDERCKKENVLGRKLWSCDIMLSSKCHDRTIIHEDLHARSGSYLNPVIYYSYGKMEEASVELLAKFVLQRRYHLHRIRIKMLMFYIESMQLLVFVIVTWILQQRYLQKIFGEDMIGWRRKWISSWKRIRNIEMNWMRLCKT